VFPTKKPHHVAGLFRTEPSGYHAHPNYKEPYQTVLFQQKKPVQTTSWCSGAVRQRREVVSAMKDKRGYDPFFGLPEKECPAPENCCLFGYIKIKLC